MGDGKHIIVLGAGPCGLASAYFAQQAGYRVTIIEKESFVGGKGASFTNGDYILDFGPHTYHPRTKEINDLIIPHAGEGFFLTPVKMELVLKNKRLRYPFSPIEGFLKFDALLTVRILFDYVVAQIKNKFSSSRHDSFRSYGISKFGRTLYDLCFGDYTERVWGIPAENISVILAKRKLPKLSLKEMLREMLFGKSNMNNHIITNEVGYHQKGIGVIYENIANGIINNGGRIITQASAQAIQLDSSGNVSGIKLIGSSDEFVKCDYLISTIPITALQGLIPQIQGESSARLHYRDILLVYAYLKKPFLSNSHWIYLVDNSFKFQRISEQKNLSKSCCPADTTVITMEISCPRESSMWNWEPEQFREMVLKDLEIFDVKPSDLFNITVTKLEDAYPIYASDYESHLGEVFKFISRIPNLITTGRQGLFLDIGMHDAMALGKRAVDHLIGPVESNEAFYLRHSFIGN